MSLWDLPSVDQLVRTRIAEYWATHCDPYMMTMPFFESPIVYVSSLVAVAAIVILTRLLVSASDRRSQPKSSSRKQGTSGILVPDVRPILLIHNGFCFGVYGVGLLILLTQSKLSNLLTSCQAPVITEFHQQAIKHTVYTYHLVSFACLVDPLIKAIGRRAIDVPADIVHQVCWSFLLMIYSCLNPVGIPVSIVIFDAVHNVLRFGHSVLRIGSDSKTESGAAGSKFSDGVRALIFSIISAHAYQTQSSIRANGCRPPTLDSNYSTAIFFPVAVYSAIVSALSVLRLVSHFLPPQTRIEKQVLASSSGRVLRKNVRLTKLPVLNS